MDGAGVIARLLVIALAACGTAQADGSGSGTGTGTGSATPAAVSTAGKVFDTIKVAIPDGWVHLPAVENAAVDAAAKMPSALTTIEAWGDRAAGCYAIAALATGKNAEGIGRSVERFAAELAPLGVDATALPKPVNEVVDATLPIKGGELTGQVKVRIFRAADQHPRAVALACAGNPREPERCTTQCEALLLQMAPPVAP